MKMVDTNVAKPHRNGLVIQTDLHRCHIGQLHVYNIFIDDDLNARTVEQLEIPALKKQKRPLIGGLPTPGSLKSERKEIKTLLISTLNNRPGFRLTLTDAVAKYKLNVGNVDETHEEPEFSVYSYLSTIEINYYPSIITPNEHVERWLNEFINIIERLPTNYLGNYMSGLRYIEGICTIEPEPNDLKVLEMLLSSSEITFSIQKDFDPADFLGEAGDTQFEVKTLTSLFKLLSRIEHNPNMTLSELASDYSGDLTYLCSKLLILEERGQIDIIRPEVFDLESLFN